jgi:hypothetical protein
MESFNELIPLAATAIPILVAIIISPTGSNRSRVLASIIMSACLPAASMVIEQMITDPKVLAMEFMAALLAQVGSYQMIKGVNPEFNYSMGEQGFGRIEIDE